MRSPADGQTAVEDADSAIHGSRERRLRIRIGFALLKNWLFVGSKEAGERAAAILSLIESAKLNGHDAWAYMMDVFERLPTLRDRDLHTLLPHNWRPAKPPAAPRVVVSITSATPAVPTAVAQPACADAVTA